MIPSLEENRPGTRHLRALTSLRFVAALGVVVHHFGASLEPLLPAFGDNLIQHGKNGVAFFFILSGFILTHTYGESAERGTLRLPEFWRNRFARVVPLYLLLLIATAPLAIYSVRVQGLEFSPGYLVAFVVTKLTLLHSWYPPFMYDPPWVIPGWTLSVEAFFYALFPLLALGTSRLGNRALLPMAGALLVLTWAPRVLVAGAKPTFESLTFAQCFPPLRLAEFALGIVLGTVYRRGLAGERGTALGHLGLALAIGATGLSAGSDTSPIGLVFTTGFGLTILGFASARGPLARLLASRGFVRLGEASLSLYLLHFPLGTLLNGAFTRLGFPISGSPVAFVLYLLLAIAASLLCHRQVEEPLRRWARGRRMLGRHRT